MVDTSPRDERASSGPTSASTPSSAPSSSLSLLSQFSEPFYAAIVMAIGMGFGRFAFTALYPHMVAEGWLTVHEGSVAASANYAGYLIGALLSIRLRARDAQAIGIISVIGTILCLALPAIMHRPWDITILRGVAGVFSAMSMVAGSLWLLDHRQRAHQAPLLYGGVGVGIALSAELLVLGSSLGLHSGGLWLILAVASTIFGAIATRGLVVTGKLPVPGPVSAVTGIAAAEPRRDVHRHRLVRPSVLLALYTLAGFGYIVTATYLPLLVKSALPTLNPAHVWALFGLGAAPSCLLWHRVHERFGTRRALMLNLIVQAIGVVLPVVANNAAGYLLCALLVGGTFVGTVTIAMPAAQRVAKTVRGNLMAMMTTLYGLGQIIGPILSTALYSQSHNFSASLIVAACALILGAVAALYLDAVPASTPRDAAVG